MMSKIADSDNKDGFTLDIDTQVVTIIKQESNTKIVGEEMSMSDKTYRYIRLNDTRGVSHKIIMHSIELSIFEELTTELISMNEDYHIFIFSFVNYILGEKVKSYFFLRKSNKYIKEIMSDSMHTEH